MCEARRETICRIGAYLYVFAGKDYMWEKRLHVLDQEKGRMEDATVLGRIKRDMMYFQYYLIALCSSVAAIYKIVNSAVAN